MTTTRKPAREANNKSRNANHPKHYVIPENAISALIGSLSLHDIEGVAARLQRVADVTSGAFQNKIEQLEPSDLKLIKKIALESRNSRYRWIMTEIIGLVARGPHGINAAHLIANSAVELAFRWTPEYFSALNDYRDKVRLKRPTRQEQMSRQGETRAVRPNLR